MAISKISILWLLSRLVWVLPGRKLLKTGFLVMWFPGGGGISGMNLVQVGRWASSYPPYKCILEYGKIIPINVYTIMEDNKKCSLFPFKLSCLMQKIISTVKCWIINWFLSESNKITWRDKGQVVRLSTAGDWMEGYKCIFEMKSWPIDV